MMMLMMMMTSYGDLNGSLVVGGVLVAVLRHALRASSTISCASPRSRNRPSVGRASIGTASCTGDASRSSAACSDASRRVGARTPHVRR